MKKTRVINLALSVVLTISMLLPSVSAFASEQTESPPGTAENGTISTEVADDTVGGSMLALGAAEALQGYTAQLFKKGQEPNNPVGSGTVLSLSDNLVLGIKMASLSDVTPGTEYTVTLPVGIKAPVANGSKNITSTSVSGTGKFATMSWTANSMTLSIVFENVAELAMLVNAYMYFDCGLDKDNLQDGDDQGNASITPPNGTKVTFKVSELMPKPPELTKTVGSVDANGKATWTVTYKHPLADYKGDKPTVLVDALPSGLEYIENSAKVTVGTTPQTAATVSVADNKLTYTLPALSDGATVVLSYETTLTNAEMSNIWAKKDKTDYKYKNAIEGLKDNNPLATPLKATAELVVPKTWGSQQMLSKNGTVTADGRSINWTVTVNTASRGFNHLYVIDTMGKGLTLNPTTVSVDADGSTSIVTPTVTALADGKSEMTIKLVENKTPATVVAVYTIKYKTSIDPKYFDPNESNKPSTEDVSNSARLDYSWPEGKGPGNPPLPPAIGKGPGDAGFSQELIKKSAVKNASDTIYDYSSRKLTWQITVNPNKVDLTTALIEDDLTDKEQLYVATANDVDELAAAKTAVETAITNAISGLGGVSIVANSLTLTDTKLTFKLNGLGTNTFSFNIETYSSNPKNWAGNVEKEYQNTVVMKKDDTEIGGTPLANDTSSTAKNKVIHTAFEKTHTNYESSTNTLSWQFAVNKDIFALGAVDITDELPAGITYVSGSEKLDNGSFASPNTFAVIGNKITVHLDNVTTTQLIAFDTIVDVNTTDFKTKEAVDIVNVGKMISATNPGETSSSSSTATINNNIMKKTFTNSDGTVNYKVEINPIGTKLSSGTTVPFTDTLSDGLYFDSDTFHLYEATRTANGPTGGKYTVALTKGSEVSPKVSAVQNNANSFTVTLPDNTKSYIAEYTAYAVKVGALTNEVALGSSLISGSNHGKSEATFNMSASGGAELGLPAGVKDKFLSITIKNVDVNNTAKPLKKARFAAYDRAGGTLLSTFSCDDNGMATIVIPKSLLGSGVTAFYIQQIIAPTDSGYVLNTTPFLIDTAAPQPSGVFLVKNGTTDLNPNPPITPTPPNYNWGSTGSSGEDPEEVVDTPQDISPKPTTPPPAITGLPKTGVLDYGFALITIAVMAVFNLIVFIIKHNRTIKQIK